MSQGELADRRTARGRGPAGTEAHHALLQDEATRNFASSKTVLNQNFRTLLRTATAPRVFRPMELRAGEALRGRSLQRSCRAASNHRREESRGLQSSDSHHPQGAEYIPLATARCTAEGRRDAAKHTRR